jgi:hypothetical protein
MRESVQIAQQEKSSNRAGRQAKIIIHPPFVGYLITPYYISRGLFFELMADIE